MRSYSALLPRFTVPLLSIIVVTLLALWLYRGALSLAYFNDDPSGHFGWMEGQTSVDFFTGSAGYGYYRPVVFTALRLLETLFGSAEWPHNPTADHALLWLLHGANTALVWALTFRLSRRASAAWVAALFFALVPFSYEAVAYVASLTHPLLTFWTLLALSFYDRSLQRSHSIEESAFSSADGRGREDWQPAGGIPSRPTTGGRGRASEDALLLAGGGLSLVPRRSLLAALSFLVLGLLTHESGLFIFPALVGLDWLRRPGSTIVQRARRLWSFAIPPMLFALLWLLIPKGSEQGLNSLSAIGRNVVPFLQTLVYPMLPLLRLDSGDVGVLVLVAVIVVALFGILARQVGVGRLWAFALGWFALSALPAMLFLQPAYVYGSPRLSYLPSIGAGVLWTVPVRWLAGRRQGSKGAWVQGGRGEEQLSRSASPLLPFSPAPLLLLALLVVYSLALILPPIPFIRCQLAFYAETSRFARDMAAAGAAAPTGKDVIFVNAPFFFSSTAALPDGCPAPYPWTPVGGILIPPYAQARDFVRFNGGPDRPVDGVTYPGYAPGWRTFGPEIDGATLRQAAAEDAVYVFDLTAGAFRDLSAAWQPDADTIESPLATFGDALHLVEALVSIDDDGRILTANLAWRVLGVPAETLAAFVHVYDAAGALVAQSDGPPGDGMAPQPLWHPGDALRDARHIDLSAVMPGVYTVAVGVYCTTDGARLAAEAEGQQLPDDALIIDSFETVFGAETIP